jgi:hypothetical protein
MCDAPVKRAVTWDASDPEIRLMGAISELAGFAADSRFSNPLSPAALERVGVWFAARCKEIAKVKETVDG